MGYYDEWENGMYDDYVEPSEDQINDWNIHNDHQDDNEDIEKIFCDSCSNPFVPHWDDVNCDDCMTKWWRANPDPADVAAQEDREAECFGLDIPWAGEF